MEYIAKAERYETMKYNRCGKSGLLLPALSLGLWHNFGNTSDFTECREMLLESFDRGITHFDLANNYGPEAGSAEETFGRVMTEELKPYRDEMIISTKAGYYMWPGPYGEWGSKKNLVASLDQSLKRMKLDYVDIFYHHRPDPDTPLEETMDALAGIVKSGKALYVGISNYNAEQTEDAVRMLDTMGIHCLIHQMQMSMIHRENEAVLDVLNRHGVGAIAFSPLAQGILTGKYINGIPADSRAAGASVFLNANHVTGSVEVITKRLMEISDGRGQSLAQMALAWVLQKKGMTSVIIGASRTEQIVENLKTMENMAFTEEELRRIDEILYDETEV
ncbi:MAG: aldo/keto reductase [Hungatella hathewayi]|uniref:aldo/keto reductase n=1 Tax=Hungatella TaxID=1649459 RepID=UPI001107477C|nr:MULTISPECIES: aldo/keto reductase [Hungatella]MCI7381272.1 aldo/keto reductase [Hungatella sp.]MDY6237528.1 aldo/keto reductase [Hungatella hathewayi]